MKATSTTRIFVPTSTCRLGLVLRRQRRLTLWTLLVMFTALGSLAFVAACLV
jgi:hypothetical protein